MESETLGEQETIKESQDDRDDQWVFREFKCVNGRSLGRFRVHGSRKQPFPVGH
jgi:hypothetical protein